MRFLATAQRSTKWRREFAVAGRHTVRLEVSGERSAHAKDHVFHLDGVCVETD